MKTRTAVPTRVLDLVLIGDGEDIAALTAIARHAGALVFRSAPALVSDGRQRVALRLHLHHR
ncbi:hypothetical protein C7C45_14580 [Micromonospora arborensis]|uniref:Uncharacterized protein n=1 Tax=Micromonospora arborensis TaxID=2116518 RepID=A0A318NIT0_9ACTN|nr:hypothetical protein [Micromonospora arborensis]PYC69912.1 hypothetical protein C7C45_14580 [Micromonospora arborensis]